MSLAFEPKVLRYANLYFFIQNLSEWHFSNRKAHNETWRHELSFSTPAENCIRLFRKIHQRYPFGDQYLGRPFFLHKDPWPAIELLTGEDSTEIKNIFVALEPYFNTIYIKDEIKLKQWAEIISKPDFIINADYINNTLANFYGCTPYNENCTVYLLLSTEKSNGGTSGTISDNAVTLEVSHTPLTSVKHISNILWHELIHLYFRNFLFNPLSEKCTNNNLEVIGKVDELIASALLPKGLLAQDTLPSLIEARTSGYFNARFGSEEIINIQKLIYPYLEQKKVMDEELMSEICRMCSENK